MKENCFKLINEDCLLGIKNIENDSVDLIVTDPPYRISPRGCSGNSGGMLTGKLSMEGKIFNNNNIEPEEYIPQLYRILKDGSHCYIMTNHNNLQKFINVSTEVGFRFTKCLIWDKGNKIMGRFYMSQFEYILFLGKGKGKKINNCGTSDILRIPNKKTKDLNGKNLHDTEKPVDLMKILIENSSNKGDLVLDPFFGIGSTAIACKELNRNFLGFEIDENYYNVALNRLFGYRVKLINNSTINFTRI